MNGCDQAAAVSVPDDDCVLRDLKLQEALAVNWMNGAKQVRRSVSAGEGVFRTCGLREMRGSAWAWMAAGSDVV